MNENPYEAPQPSAQVVGVLSGTREDLRNVAKYQKGVLICILLQLVSLVVVYLIPPELRGLLSLGVIVAGIAGTVFVFLLATKVYGAGAGILLGILTFIPCLGLIVLLIINGKATSVLKQNGIRVGLLGANISEI